MEVEPYARVSLGYLNSLEYFKKIINLTSEVVPLLIRIQLLITCVSGWTHMIADVRIY